jgi:TonB family protein
VKRNAAVLVLLLVLGVVLAQNPTPAPPSPTGAADTSTKTATEGAYRVGGVVKPPRVTYAPDPTYPKKARKPRHQDIVVLWLVVGRDGLPRDVRVARSLSPEFDEAAMDAVKKWKFDPATKDGKPVPVMINVEITFRR